MITFPNDKNPEDRQRRLALTGILEHTIRSLELTQQQRDSAEKTYQECGEHLAKSLGVSQDRGDIFPQGSMRLGTAIRPLRDITEVFDLDVVFRIVCPRSTLNPKAFRDDVGRHLRTKYNGAVKPLPKGWRLDFSAERDYHLDVIPAADSPVGDGVISITDASSWKDSHPRGFAGWFENIARVLPRYGSAETRNRGTLVIANSASIEPLPEHTDFKSPLHRVTQVVKRHRDFHFNKKTKKPELLTASIVVTTLLAKSYQRVVAERFFESGFDVLLACVEDMPSHLEAWPEGGKMRYRLRNPSLLTENLVAKWDEERFALAFYAWHGELVGFLRGLLANGAPQRSLLVEAMGERAVTAAFAKQMEGISAARNRGLLTVRSGVGLGLGGPLVVPRHTPHGSR